MTFFSPLHNIGCHFPTFFLFYFIIAVFYFLASPRSMWDLSSPTRDWTFSIGSTES